MKDYNKFCFGIFHVVLLSKVFFFVVATGFTITSTTKLTTTLFNQQQQQQQKLLCSTWLLFYQQDPNNDNDTKGSNREAVNLSFEQQQQQTLPPTIDIANIIMTDLTNNNYDNPSQAASSSSSSSSFLLSQSIHDWLHSIDTVTRSKPIWISTPSSPTVLELSIADILFELLQNVLPFPFNRQDLFPNIAVPTKLDLEWKYILLKYLHSTTTSNDGDTKTNRETNVDGVTTTTTTTTSSNLNNDNNIIMDIMNRGICNTHPMRFQIVGIPANTSLPLHVHPAMELDIPLMGTLHEYTTNVVIGNDNDDNNISLLQRPIQYSIGSPISTMSNPPTLQDLKIIAQELSNQQWPKCLGQNGAFTHKTVTPGTVLINPIGSIHQSFTTVNEPCLLFVFGPNVHGYFSNFQQRVGIEMLQNIQHLIK